MTSLPAGISRFRILFVCTGNICRSPFAEVLTRHLLDESLDAADAARFVVSSAGTAGMTGFGMHPLSRAELAPWGLEGTAGEFTARCLDVAAITEADLVLTAERQHRRQVVHLHPAAVATTFCLRELTRLVNEMDAATLHAEPVERAHAVVAAAHLRRGMMGYVTAEDDAVPDPIGLPAVAHHASAEIAAGAVSGLVTLLTARSRQTGRGVFQRM